MQLGMVHRGKEVVQEVVPEGGGGQEEAAALAPDVPDGVHLLEPPVAARQGTVTHVEEVRVLVGGDEGGEGHPVASSAMDHHHEAEAGPCVEAGEVVHHSEVEGGHQVQGGQLAVADDH